MTYSLTEFCDETRAILAASDDHTGRDLIRQKLELLLQDEAFLAAHVAGAAGMQQIYQDAERDFCVLAYRMDAPRTSPPHDHGGTWAVYGQASGYTDMTLWRVAGDATTAIEPMRRFRLEPGQAGLFDVGEVHSIEYPAGASFVRVTGRDLSNETRRVYDPEAGTVREIEHVGTGNAR